MSCEKQISLSPDKSGIDGFLCAGARALVRLYQHLLSPLLGGHCRFHPSCSQYALDAFSRKPFLAACRLTLLRLVKCQPLHPGGYDPVERQPEESTYSAEKDGE